MPYFKLVRKIHIVPIMSVLFLWKIQVVEYQVGDVLDVLPGQNSASVDAFIKRCKLDPDSYITVCNANPFFSSV